MKWSPGKALIYKQILSTFFKKMYGDQSGEFVFGYWGLCNACYRFRFRLSPCEGLCLTFSLHLSPSESDVSVSDNSLDDDDDDDDEDEAEEDESDWTPVGSSIWTPSAISAISGLSL